MTYNVFSGTLKPAHTFVNECSADESCWCRTPAPLVPTTPASLSRYCLVDVDSFPSPFSGELFGANFVSLDPLPLPPPSSASLTPYQLSADAGAGQRDGRLLTLAAAGLSPRATATTAATNRDNEVTSSCVSGVVTDDHQQQQTPQHADIARCVPAASLEVAPTTLAPPAARRSGNDVRAYQRSYSTSDPVSTGIDDRLRTG